MKNYQRLSIRRLFFLIGLIALSACGQKGPLEIERPPAVQEEELEEAI